jgi:very-short-patch-repair endonuclease
MIRICYICKREFKSSHKLRCCSIACCAKWRKIAYRGKGNPRWRGGFHNRICCVCGRKFWGSDATVKFCLNHRYLVGERNPNWTGGKILIKVYCQCCRKGFLAKTSQVRRGRKFCSQACSNIIKNKNNKKKGTALEQEIENCLKGLKVLYKKQVPIKNITLADFVVGTTIIQCDGVYWHTLRGRPEKDREQNSRLKNLGYTVIRISDTDIKNEGVERALKRKAIIATLHNQNVVSWQN